MTWSERSACLDAPHLTLDDWVPQANVAYRVPGPKVQASIDACKAVCARCEVRSECLDEALASVSEVAIRGGLTVSERNRMPGPSRVGRPRQPINHGTEGGYRRHLERKVPTCDACRQAHTDHRRQDAARRRAAS